MVASTQRSRNHASKSILVNASTNSLAQIKNNASALEGMRWQRSARYSHKSTTSVVLGCPIYGNVGKSRKKKLWILVPMTLSPINAGIVDMLSPFSN